MIVMFIYSTCIMFFYKEDSEETNEQSFEHIPWGTNYILKL